MLRVLDVRYFTPLNNYHYIISFHRSVTVVFSYSLLQQNPYGKLVMKEGGLYWLMVLEVHIPGSGGSCWFSCLVRLDQGDGAGCAEEQLLGEPGGREGCQA